MVVLKDKWRRPGDKIVFVPRKPKKCKWNWKDAFEPGELKRDGIVILVCLIVTIVTGLMLAGVFKC